MKKLLKIAAIVGLAMALSTAPLSAQAQDASVDDQVKDWYLSNGVSPIVAENLIEKFNSGELLDSMRGAAPIATQSAVTGGVQKTISTFADGSVSVTEIEIPVATTGEIRPFAIGNCSSTQSGSGYVNYYDCAISGSNAYLEIQFRANYTRTSAGVGSISYVGSPYVWALGGTATTPTLAITKSVSNASGPASAQATTQYSSATLSHSARLYLKVAATAYTTTSGL